MTLDSRLSCAFLAAAMMGCGGAPPAAPHAAPPGGAKPAARKASPAAATTSVEVADPSHPPGASNEPSPGLSLPVGIRRGSQQESTPRPHVTPIPFRVAELPWATIPDPFPQNTTGAGVPNLALGDTATDLVITTNAADRGTPDDRSVIASVKDAAFAQLKFGPYVGWSGGVYGTSGGAYLRCGNRGGVPLLLPSRWETLKTRASGADYAVADGWFERTQCKASVVRRATATAKPLVPGQTVYAFRACGTTCAEKQALVLIMPRAQSIVATGVGGDAPKEVGAFTKVTLPLRRGGGGSVMARIAMPDLLAWRAAMGPDDKSGKKPKSVSFGSFVASVLVGVEVVQGVDDAEPVAIVYQDPADPLGSGDPG